MTDSRTAMLQRIREAVADSATASPVPRDYRHGGTHPPGSPAVIELLVDRLVDYRAQVQVVAPGELAVAIAAALRPSSTVVLADDAPAELTDAAAGAGVRVVTDRRSAPLSATDLDRLDAVLTTAAVAVAVTGTIVLDAGPGQGRRAITLVPDRHIVVLHAGQIVESVPEAIARLELSATRPLTMISGPSATSDIELSRVEGVHGPRTLIVLIVR